MIANRPNQKRPAKMTPAVALAVQVAVRAERNNRPDLRDCANGQHQVGDDYPTIRPFYSIHLVVSRLVRLVPDSSTSFKMITTLAGFPVPPMFRGISVVDFSAIQSLEEFRSLVEQAGIIMAGEKSRTTDKIRILCGLEVVDAIRYGVLPPQRLLAVFFAVDCSHGCGDFERICTWTKAVKGFHDWAPLNA